MVMEREMPDLDRPRTTMIRSCLALGWQVSALSREPLRAGAPADELVLGGLSPSELLELGLERVARQVETMAAVSDRVAGMLPRLEDAVHAIAYSAEESDVRRALSDLNAELLVTLSKLEDRYGVAYRLGEALADTCVPAQSPAQLAQHLAPDRVSELQSWLNELRADLPEHAADAVAQSLGSWAAWAAGHGASDTTEQPASREPDMSSAAGTLETQGRRWRAVLTGERASTDVLEAEDYEAVAAAVLARTRSVGAGAARTFALPLVLATALFGLGVALIVAWSGGARVIAGLGAMVLAVAVIWRVGAALLGPITDRLEGPFWRAAFAAAVARRLTTLPQVAVATPEERRPVRITRRHVVREAPYPGNPRQPGSDDTASGEAPAPAPVFGPPLPPRDPEVTLEAEERTDTLRLQAASRAPGRSR